MNSPLPLIVDLDDTLLATDSLHEQFVRQLFLRPIRTLLLLRYIFSSRAMFKAKMAEAEEADPGIMPMRENFVLWLRDLVSEGRELHLCTAAHQSVADAAARRLGVFRSVIGTQQTNLKGHIKADHLARHFPDGFVYAGDSPNDLAVWERAQGVVLVGASPATERRARALGKPVEAVFPRERAGLGDWLKAARVHHWTKNALVFLPFILGHGWTAPGSLVPVVFGFAALLMVVSSTYMINDLADLSSDRAHWSKCHRPIASGRISILSALIVATLGILGGLLAGLFISIPFEVALASYLVITLAYSFGLKQVPLLDTFIIGLLFTLRLVMGTALAGQRYSEWLFAFSMLFFFSLATAKRQTELLRTVTKGGSGARGYRVEDIALLSNFGVSAGVSSIVILCLYLTSDAVQKVVYAQPAFLWAAPLVVSVWLGRIWLLASRGEMRDDPVSFAIRDRASIGLGALAVLAFVLAML